MSTLARSSGTEGLNTWLASDAAYRLLVQSVVDYAIYMLDVDGRVANWNAGAERAKGYTADEIVGQHFSRFYTREDVAAGEPVRTLETARSVGRFEAEGWRMRKDGSLFWAHVVVDAIHDEDGVLIGFAKITRDRTEQRAIETARFETERRFRLLVQGVVDYAIYMLDVDGRVANWNAGAERAKGYTADEIVGQHFSRFYTPEDVAAGEPVRTLETARSVGRFEAEGWRMRKDGSLFWAHVVVDAIHDEDGALIGFAKITRDRTRQKSAEDEVARLSEQDSLTGLANRAVIWRAVAETFAPGEADRFALAFVDLDGFKAVNDMLGHRAGDTLLRRVADRLRVAAPEAAVIARFGGDEFALLFQARSVSALEAFGDALVEALGAPYEIDEARVDQVSASVGLAWIDATDGASEVFSQADCALYAAKAAGKACWRMFSAELEAAWRESHLIEAELPEALRAGQFSLVYQPIVELGSGRTSTREALIRWRHPTRGPISPGRFIPVAEASGAIRAIGAWVLERACADAAGWADDAVVAVNLSPRQLGGGLVELVLETLMRTGLSPARLELEITETALIKGEAAVLADLRRLRAMGVRIALDDFGVGFSSLSHIRTFPFDRIKIDGAFVRDAVARKDCRAIVGVIADLGWRLGVETVAEGVETPEQRDLARAEGCTHVQGYLLARPAALDPAGRPVEEALAA